MRGLAFQPQIRRTHPMIWAPVVAVALWAFSAPAMAGDQSCKVLGPQTPRDITKTAGTNPNAFALAPKPEKLNLCNIHFHKQAEHKAPGYSIPAGEGVHGGFRCNATPTLTTKDINYKGGPVCNNVLPGDTIEVHWVHTSCDIKPGPTLGACLADDCTDPKLRVEAQTFLVVNDENAMNFEDYAWRQTRRNGMWQAKALPEGTGEPVVFRGSTTGPTFDDEAKCSPLEVTWSVRPECARVNIASLGKWCEKNAFEEKSAQGVRVLVTDPAYLSEIE